MLFRSVSSLLYPTSTSSSSAPSASSSPPESPTPVRSSPPSPAPQLTKPTSRSHRQSPHASRPSRGTLVLLVARRRPEDHQDRRRGGVVPRRRAETHSVRRDRSFPFACFAARAFADGWGAGGDSVFGKGKDLPGYGQGACFGRRGRRGTDEVRRLWRPWPKFRRLGYYGKKERHE